MEHHTLSTYMIGKIDHAGRLIPGEIRYAAYPNAPFWQNRLEGLKASLIFFMGTEDYDLWVEADIADEDTFKDAVAKMQKKLNEVRNG